MSHSFYYNLKYLTQVAVLERRPVLGGAAVTEEIVPGYKFSRSDTAELSLVLASPHTVLSLVDIGSVSLIHKNAGGPLVQQSLIQSELRAESAEAADPD